MNERIIHSTDMRLDAPAEVAQLRDLSRRAVSTVRVRHDDDQPGSDPLRVDVAPQLENRNRLTVGLRIVWIIPILVYTALIVVAAILAVVVAAFAVLFTGRWPRGLREFAINSGRLTLRVGAHARLLTDTYPSFSLSAS